MIQFGDLPIKRKITLIILLTAGVVILLTSAASIVTQLISSRNGLIRTVSSLAEVVGKNCTATLSSRDHHAANEILSALRAEPHILGASIYTEDGKIFATYRRDCNIGFPLTPYDPTTSRNSKIVYNRPGAHQKDYGLFDNYLDLVKPLTFNGRVIGQLLIRADQGWLYSKLRMFMGIVACGMVGLFLVSYFVSARLQGIISEPIHTLAVTIKTVSTEKDYSVRAVKRNNDELGILIDGFNEMLMQIQARDRELKKRRKELEEQVALRTKALKISEKQKKQLLIQREIQETYNELVGVLNSIDISEILKKSLNMIVEQTGAGWGGFYLWNNDSEILSLKSSFFPEPYNSMPLDPETILPHADKLAYKVFRQKEMITRRWRLTGSHKEKHKVRVSGYPLGFREKQLGILVLADIGTLDQYTKDFLHNSTGQLGVALNNALTLQDLRDKSAQLKQSNMELIRASEMKSAFLANMSHELRTPLNAIIGFSEVLVDKHFGELNETQEEYLNDILSSGKHLLSLINDILDLSKVEAGKVELAISPVDIEELLTASVTMVKEKAMKHAIRIVVDADDVPETIEADKRRLKQVLFNLLSNATKFTPDGGKISLKAEMTRRESLEQHIPASFKNELDFLRNNPSESFLKISVSDTGIGIHPESIKRIFGAFEQEETSISRKYQGTGLGLALCRNLLELHGGAIWAESDSNKGSTFTFALPFQKEGDTVTTILNDQTRLPAPESERMNPTVLVVEDDEKELRRYPGAK